MTDIDAIRARWQQRLRYMREHSGPGGTSLSRPHFAALIAGPGAYVAASTVEAWEMRGTIPHGETIIRLAAHLPDGWTLEYLLGLAADPPGTPAASDLEAHAEHFEDAARDATSRAPDADGQPASTPPRRAKDGQP